MSVAQLSNYEAVGEENQDTYGIQKFFEVKNRNFKFELSSLSMKGGECGLLIFSPIPSPFARWLALLNPRSNYSLS